jgi:hypothetical protein
MTATKMNEALTNTPASTQARVTSFLRTVAKDELVLRFGIHQRGNSRAPMGQTPCACIDERERRWSMKIAKWHLK